MKNITVLIAVLFFTCSKENNSTKVQVGSLTSTVAAPDTAKIPLNDLGTGTFIGYTGGLFPGFKLSIYYISL